MKRKNGCFAGIEYQIYFMMTLLPEIYSCKTKEEMLKQITDVHNAIVNFYREIPDNAFQKNAIPDGWSVKKNMKHIISSNYLFARYIGLPRFFIKLLGKPDSPQKAIDKISPTNRPSIKDYGKYTEREVYKLGLKEKLLQDITESSEKLKKAVQKRTEEELDDLSGLFWGMNLRTFVLFILKHNVHHSNVARARLENK